MLCNETHAEERANWITHAVGVLLSVAALTLLVVFASLHGDPRRIVTVSIYGATLLLMYTASTCYHYVRSPRIKHGMRIFDHAAIFLLIAGTYTPIVLVSMGGGWGWSMFGVVWGFALLGVIAKCFFVNRWHRLSVTVYLAMAWLALIGIKPMLAALPAGGLVWIFTGGVAYTAGVVFYLWEHLPFNHAIWHLFVLAGSVCHFFAVLLYVVPVPPV
jgi:hemolysin III